MIRKIRLIAANKVSVQVRGGTADRGEMARVDVFLEERTGKAGRFHLVPIYPHQIVDPLQNTPPNRAIVAHEPENAWTLIDNFTFVFSLYMNCLVRVPGKNGEPALGYYKGTDRDNAKIKIANPVSSQLEPIRVSTKTLPMFEKWAVDRLGRVSRVPQEIRTWHGVACT